MNYYPRIRSKNTSCKELRNKKGGVGFLGFYPYKVIIRLGSQTPTSSIIKESSKKPIIEINTVEAIENSRSKLKMKDCFRKAEISQSKWWLWDEILKVMVPDDPTFTIDGEKNVQLSDLPYPILVKKVYGFKGHGMVKLDNKESLESWLKNHSIKDPWYFEEFHNYNREYRLHCTKEGCFYTCRKMLRSDATDRWYRNDSNCVWILEENPLFDKPSNWKTIEEQCIKALNATGLDIGAFDVRVQSSKTSEGKNRKDPHFIIIEVNSAPAFGEITLIKYTEQLKKIISSKIDDLNK